MRIAGLTRCTAYDPPTEKLISNKILGPDQGWTLLSKEQVKGFCAGEGKKLVHRGKNHYKHVCASYSQWAFDAHDSSYIRCVVFLHYKTPKKAESMLGDPDVASGAKVFNINGSALLSRYNELRRMEDGVHVWMRPSHGEIAIDFCLGHCAELETNREGRIVLPDFIPKK